MIIHSLMIFSGERYVVGVGEGVKETDSLRRELIHKLFIAPLAHSQILKEFRVCMVTMVSALCIILYVLHDVCTVYYTVCTT